MKKNILIVICTILIWCLSPSIYAFTPKEKMKIIRRRYSLIDFHHIGCGLEAGLNANSFAAPKVFYGIGSYRNLLNLDLGLKYLMYNPLLGKGPEYISPHYLSSFSSFRVNAVRWKYGSIYLGGEMAYNLSTVALHRKRISNELYRDKNIGNNHFGNRGIIGVRVNRWDINIYYDYSMGPVMNQKYIFETPAFDYDFLQPYLYERARLGFSISYMLSL